MDGGATLDLGAQTADTSILNLYYGYVTDGTVDSSTEVDLFYGEVSATLSGTASIDKDNVAAVYSLTGISIVSLTGIASNTAILSSAADASAITAPTNINSGTLDVECIIGDSIFVNAGTSLTGNGSFAHNGTVSGGATLVLGSQSGTGVMSFGGNLTFDTGSALDDDIADRTLIDVGGRLTIQHGTSSVVTVNVENDTSTTPYQYLFNYGSLDLANQAGYANLTFTGLASGVSPINDTSNNSIDIGISGGGNSLLYWVGTSRSSGGSWSGSWDNVSSNMDWAIGSVLGTLTAWIPGAVAVFPSSGGTSPYTVTVNAQIALGGMTFLTTTTIDEGSSTRQWRFRQGRALDVFEYFGVDHDRERREPPPNWTLDIAKNCAPCRAFTLWVRAERF